MIGGYLVQDQVNTITFVLVNASYTEVSGLGTGWTMEISKNGGAFVASTGTKAEISDGWYSYQLTASECDTIGPLSIRITHASIVQQNLEYVVRQRTAGCSEYTYTAEDSVTTDPIPGVDIWVTTDIAGSNVIWRGTTDAFGVARDVANLLPCLDPGTYYFWKQWVGYTDDDNPDTEVVT